MNAPIVGLKGVKMEEETRKGVMEAGRGQRLSGIPKQGLASRRQTVFQVLRWAHITAVSEADAGSASWGLQCERDADPGNRDGWILQHTGHVWGCPVRLGWDSGLWL